MSPHPSSKMGTTALTCASIITLVRKIISSAGIATTSTTSSTAGHLPDMLTAATLSSTLISLDRSQNLAVGETHIFTPACRQRLSGWGQPRSRPNGCNRTANTFGIPAAVRHSGRTPDCTNNGGLTKVHHRKSLVLRLIQCVGRCEIWAQLRKLTDDLTVIRGRHTLKFGFEVQRVITPFDQPPNSRGVFNYNGLYTSVYGQKDASTAIAMMLLQPTAANPAVGTNTSQIVERCGTQSHP